MSIQICTRHFVVPLHIMTFYTLIISLPLLGMQLLFAFRYLQQLTEIAFRVCILVVVCVNDIDVVVVLANDIKLILLSMFRFRLLLTLFTKSTCFW